MCINRIGQAGPSIYYSNSQRHGILADEDLKERVDLLESKDKENSSELKDNRRETEVLKRRVEVLETACEGYRRIRRRFFDTYKRDILRLPHVLASRDIHTGNEAAHEGNVVIDADIYDIESRNDLYVFQNLYGLEVGQVMKYSM